MVNRHRGEIEVSLDGRTWKLCLTLGALAELESSLGTDGLSGLAQHLTSGRLTAGEMLKIIGAGLRGAGHTLTDDEIKEMQAEAGAVGYVQIVSQLLNATFGAAA